MDISKTMKVASVHQFGEPLLIEQIDVPEPKKGEVLIEVAACGVCHTDLHAAKGDWPIKPQLPFIPGHEGVGTIVQLGEEVSHLKLGDRVGVPWLYEACGHCEHCIAGWETLCERQKNTGYSVNGSFAEYIVANADYVGLLPDELSFVDAAPILCAGVTTYKGLKESEVRPGEWIAIVGIGGLGHLAIQYAKAMGMNVVAIDVSDEKLALADEVGADLTINSDKRDSAEFIKTHIASGLDGALITAVATEVIPKTIQLLKRGGTCVLVGLPVGEFPTPVFDVVLKRITIRGSIVGNRNDLQESLRLAADGKINAHSRCKPLNEINNVFEAMEKGDIQGRVVLKMQ